MAWLLLLIAGMFETAWALCLKESEGFTRPWQTAGFAVSLVVSMGLLGLALRTLCGAAVAGALAARIGPGAFVLVIG